jgi:hypothetical protein
MITPPEGVVIFQAEWPYEWSLVCPLAASAGLARVAATRSPLSARSMVRNIVSSSQEENRTETIQGPDRLEQQAWSFRRRARLLHNPQAEGH